MKFLERRLAVVQRDSVQILPVQAPNSAITVSFASKGEPVERKPGKLRNQARRKQCYRYPCAAHVAASYACNTPQQNVGLTSKRRFGEDYLGLCEVSGRQRPREQVQLRRGKPKESSEAAQRVKIPITRLLYCIQNFTLVGVTAILCRTTPRSKGNVMSRTLGLFDQRNC